jgi:hypothetical protein
MADAARAGYPRGPRRQRRSPERAAAASACPTNWRRCSGGTRPSRRPSARPRGNSGKRVGGCSPRRPASRSTRGPTTTSGSACSSWQDSETVGCTTPGTPPRRCSCSWACPTARSSASWGGPARRWRSGTSTSRRRSGGISLGESAISSGSPDSTQVEPPGRDWRPAASTSRDPPVRQPGVSVSRITLV